MIDEPMSAHEVQESLDRLLALGYIEAKIQSDGTVVYKRTAYGEAQVAEQKRRGEWGA